jgi:hypothetical protein
MKDIYRNAVFCIAATAAPNSNTGLFHDRDPRVVCPIRVELSLPFVRALSGSSPVLSCGLYSLQGQPTISHLVDDAPLNTRAWVSVHAQSRSRLC